MKKSIFILIVFFSTLAFFHAQAQENVTIEIPGKHDLKYDGSTLHLNAPNLSVGREAGLSLLSASANTIFGEQAAFKLSAGDNNTVIGYQAGANNEGSGNVFIGYQAGIQQSSVSNKLYISNSSSNSPLIYGDFETRNVTFNDNITVAGTINCWYDLVVGNDLTMLGDALCEKNMVIEKDFTVENEVNLPNYVSGSNQVLAVNSNGELINRNLKETKYNKYSFIEKLGTPATYSINEIGVNFADGITINGLEATVLDNDDSAGVSEHNAVFLALRRRSKFTTAAFETIYIIISTGTPDDTFLNLTTTTTQSSCTNCNIIDNDNYIYYISVYFCEDCDYREVTILE